MCHSSAVGFQKLSFDDKETNLFEIKLYVIYARTKQQRIALHMNKYCVIAQMNLVGGVWGGVWGGVGCVVRHCTQYCVCTA